MKSMYVLKLFLTSAVFFVVALGLLNGLKDVAVTQTIVSVDSPQFLSAILDSVQVPASDWRVNCVDCPRTFGSSPGHSIRLDAEGRPHIVAGGGDYLYYVYRGDEIWHVEIADSTPGVGEYAALALDNAGQPHISYSAGGLKYAWYDEANWHTEIVDDAETGLLYTSLALDALDHPHISYYDYTNQEIKYAWYDGADWWIETVASGAYTSLALDSRGNPHIAYGDFANDVFALKYARRDEGEWQIEVVESGIPWLCYPSLALDELDHPHISYQYQSRYLEWSNLKYAWRDESGWHTSVILEGGGHFGEYTSLALDNLGRPHIAYTNYTDVNYVWHDGENWQASVVQVANLSNWGTSLVLDAASRPHVSYYDGGDLKYAQHDGIDWQVEKVSDGASVSQGVSLALDENGWPHISYGIRQLDDTPGLCDDFKYAWYDGQEWRDEVVDIAGGAGYFNSLALDNLGRPHIAYANYLALNYLWHDGTSWRVETVEERLEQAWFTSISLALDGDGRIHISYHDSNDLKYARRDGNNWHIETIVQDGVGWFASLAVDSVGNPHIGYYDEANSQLKYAFLSPSAGAGGGDGTVWHIETIDDSRGGCISLKLDKTDRPHISYCGDPPFPELKYATLTPITGVGGRVEMGWRTEIVDDAGSVYDTALALDRDDQPHISYLDNRLLKYAQWDGAGWQIQTLGAGGADPSLALDNVDQPHIVYRYNHHLEYAWRPSLLGLNKLATPSDGLYVDDVLTYTLSLVGADANVRLHDPLPSDVNYVTGSLTSTLAPPAVYSPAIRSVVWQGQLPAEILQSLHFQVTPQISNTEALSTPRPITNVAWLTDTETHSVVSATATVELLPLPLFLDKQITPDTELGYDGILTYTLLLTGPGQNVRLWDPLPPELDCITNSLSSQLVYNSVAHAVMWQGKLPTDTQVVQFRVTPNITALRTISAPITVTNAAWLTNLDNGICVSDTASFALDPIPLSLKKRAAPLNDVGYGDLVTFTLTLAGPGLNICLWDPLPPHVQYVTGQMTGSLLLPAMYSPTAHAVLWQGQLPTDSIRLITFQVTPLITGSGSLSLPLPIVNTAWLTNVESGQVVSSTSIVNGFDLYLPVVVD